jgi:hypothetical protein
MQVHNDLQLNLLSSREQTQFLQGSILARLAQTVTPSMPQNAVPLPFSGHRPFKSIGAHLNFSWDFGLPIYVSRL